MISLWQSLSFLAIAHALIVILTIVRVIMKRPSTGSALAWILLIVLAPFAGVLIYRLIGERRIGHGRTEGIAKLRSDFRAVSDSMVMEDLLKVDWSRHPPAAPGMNSCLLLLVSLPSHWSCNLSSSFFFDGCVRGSCDVYITPNLH